MGILDYWGDVRVQIEAVQLMGFYDSNQKWVEQGRLEEWLGK